MITGTIIIITLSSFNLILHLFAHTDLTLSQALSRLAVKLDLDSYLPIQDSSWHLPPWHLTSSPVLPPAEWSLVLGFWYVINVSLLSYLVLVCVGVCVCVCVCVCVFQIKEESHCLKLRTSQNKQQKPQTNLLPLNSRRKAVISGT